MQIFMSNGTQSEDYECVSPGEVLKWTYALQVLFLLSCSSEILLSHIRDMLH